MKKILLSACFLGQKVRYDGQAKLQMHPRLQTWIKEGRVVSICPEVAGGLSVPRDPAEIQTGHSAQDVLNGTAKIMTNKGKDVTAEYIKGAQKTLQLVQQHNIQVVILKARSPSCGSKQVYDGSFSKQVIDGMGVTAALLSQHGIQVFDETEIDAALDAASS